MARYRKSEMFTKILIANRGEIACRIAATARRMGIRTVVVYSDADATAKHVQACDEAVHIGGSAARDSYLRWEKIIAAAQATGAQAVHPGYGFLSENTDFAQACTDAGLVFIGPPASAIEAMGLKAASKQLMERSGVPLVPGYHGADQNPHVLQAAADSIGYPVLIKASAGGGGKGMRVVEKAADFAAALASCQREAKNSFGNDDVLVEKYVQRPRHIEIQVFADTHGNCVYLFERDCSVQRRHQKVLEEAPAPGMTEDLRQRMGAAAVAAARAVNYVGAGTVEFIVEQSGYDQPESMQFFFMEMNTRLQVEHPVTEAITGLDLVEWQLRVASGEPLPLRQQDLRISGHAIEARICAENPDQDFLPATGRLAIFALPAHSGFERAPVRVDAGVRQGDVISPFYDSMVAKLIVHGATREQALARLDAALAQTHIVGLKTNVQFLRHVVTSDSFAQARLDTSLINREAAQVFGQEKLSLAWAGAAWVAHSLLAQAQARPVDASGWTDPWSAADAWHSHGRPARRFDVQAGAQSLVLHWQGERHGGGQLACRGAADAPDMAGPFAYAAQADGSVQVDWCGQRQRLQVYTDGAQVHVFAAQGACQFEALDRLAHAAVAPAETGRLSAPMPGKLLSFAVKVGDTVRQGQVLAVMEAMKMEHQICAPAHGQVQELLFAVGDQITEGAELLRMASPSVVA